VRDVASLSDPVFSRIEARLLDAGLILEKVKVPLGVCAVIFESRADVLPQIASLALRSGNGIVLKGGSESVAINTVYREALNEVSVQVPEIPHSWCMISHERSMVEELMGARGEIDLLIPRGSKALVDDISTRSLVPVLGHADGVCHMFIEKSADLERALQLVLDSKLQYPAACNALETVLIHASIADIFCEKLAESAENHSLSLRGCTRVCKLIPRAQPVHESEWHTEYSDRILACKIVLSTDDAIRHIERYGSGHTDCIVTNDADAQHEFLSRVESASVFVNCSTRFADGYRFGLGAEIGISTGKIHARGPVGIEGLLTYQYRLKGNYHAVDEYAAGTRHFLHKDISDV
jgi:glutamate-5-semialdehyde dehydrogenase